ncbi:hypothetical protein PM082_007270 [Marasmius tenuissimus]|nr:hypothetical protein PM082_007270 [Marasmius tenuissimus]
MMPSPLCPLDEYLHSVHSASVRRGPRHRDATASCPFILRNGFIALGCVATVRSPKAFTTCILVVHHIWFAPISGTTHCRRQPHIRLSDSDPVLNSIL